MGRWGFRMFQGDHDMDAAVEIQKKIGVQLVGKNQEDAFDTLALHPDTLESARIKLNTSLSTELMNKARTIGLGLIEPPYDALVLIAVMMHCGAKISPEDRQYAKSIYPEIAKIPGFALPLADRGFRKPGAVQFLTALENYVDGQARDFYEPSCYNCGKTERELNGEELKRCQRCVKNYSNGLYEYRIAQYYGKDCQTENWEEHKVICRPVGGMMNV